MVRMTNDDMKTRGRKRLDRHEAAAFAGVTPRTVHRWAVAGLITVERDPISGRPYYWKHELRAAMDSAHGRPGGRIGNARKPD